MNLIKEKKTHTRVSWVVISLIAVALLSLSWAQEKHAIAWEASPEQSSYPTQHVIEVGDMPGHFLRIAELHRVYPDPDTAPMFNGVRVVEEISPFFSDYIDLNGSVTGYTMFKLENGDVIYGTIKGDSHTLLDGNGELAKTDFSGVTVLTGGTGDFANIRGLIRSVIVADIAEGINQVNYEGEYWMMQ